jgi:hypothetical protein
VGSDASCGHGVAGSILPVGVLFFSMPRIPVRGVASSILPVGKYCPVLPVAVCS